jgi:hypothetical protein
VLGIIGAALANWLFGLLGIPFGGWIGYLMLALSELASLSFYGEPFEDAPHRES